MAINLPRAAALPAMGEMWVAETPGVPGLVASVPPGFCKTAFCPVQPDQ